MIDQEKIHNQCLSKNPEERIKALEQLEIEFSSLLDKQQAWNDLHRLTNDEIGYVRKEAVYVLGSVFPDIPNKQKAYRDLIKLISDQYDEVGYKAVDALCSVFSYVPDKQQAWNDLHRLTTNENYSLRYWTAVIIGSLFSQLPDKEQAWNDLHRLADDNDSLVRLGFLSALESAFSHIQDKQRAWEDLHRLTNDQHRLREYFDVKPRATDTLGSLFPQLPDKQQAWNDLHKLADDQENNVRWRAIRSIGSAFTHIPDKQQAWNDLHRLTSDDVRGDAAKAIGTAFPHLLNKEQAWEDLHKLIDDEDSNVRGDVAEAIGTAFLYLPEKQQAWNDLHKLTYDDSKYCEYVKYDVTSAIGTAFPYLPDKQQAWDDLCRLAVDECCDASHKAIGVLGSIFSQMPDKEQALQTLYELTKHQEDDIRAYANHSLGKVHIFKASKAESDKNYKKELENAIDFFKKAGQTNWCENPAQFCLPFYRSFHTIIFEKQKGKEVDKYLVEAKRAVQNSKSRQLLFEAVESLANASREVQSQENMSLKTKKDELNFYRKYCDRAEELMKNTEEKMPYAVETIRKGLPILDKKLLEEIQKKARIACNESKGTDTEGIACAISKEVQKWEIGSQEEMTQNIEGLIETFRMRMPHLTGYEHIFEEIEGIRNVSDLTRQYKIISKLVGLIPIFSSMPDHVVQDIKEIKEKTTSTSNEVKYLQFSVDRLIESVSELQNQQEYLDTIQRNLEEIKNEIPEMKGKIDEVLSELYSPLSTDQKLKIAIPIIPSLVSYEMETNVPKLVADKIDELKNLVVRLKKDKY